MNIQDLNLEAWQLALIGIVAVWELVWKGMALWRASQNDEKAWFVVLLVVNSVGILPIIYLLIKKSDD